MTSPDGITWTSRISASNNNWDFVTFGKNLFVAVSTSGTGNRVMTSAALCPSVNYMPSFADIVLAAAGLSLPPSNATPPDGKWYMDRYAPSGFGTDPLCHGRTDVLKISILGSSPSGSAGGSAFQALQGRRYDFHLQKTSWTLKADLFVESGWASSSNGLRRAELWGVSTNDKGFWAVLPAIGFTNEGSGVGRFRVASGEWSEKWFDVSATVNYGAWNSLQIEFDSAASLFTYYINGMLAGQYSSTVTSSPAANLGGASTGLASTLMQTYNYGQNYTVCWSTCNECAVGYINYPTCTQCTNATHCNGKASSVTTNANKTACVCTCNTGFTGPTCGACAAN